MEHCWVIASGSAELTRAGQIGYCGCVRCYRAQTRDLRHSGYMPPIFFYLPLIIASGLIEVMFGSAYERDESDARNHDVTIGSASLVAFPGRQGNTAKPL